MIISHTHRYIFFAVPKTATHSVREALRLSISDDDWEQQMLFGKQAIPIPEIAEIGHGHISAQQIAPALSQEQWTTYTKFAFVRNPYDRFISMCFFLNRGNPQFKNHALAWMKEALKRDKFRQRVLVRPQIEQLIGSNGQLSMDFIGRYETLQASLIELFDLLGLTEVQLKIRNSSERAKYHGYYDSDLIDLVTEFYADDLSAFDYKF